MNEDTDGSGGTGESDTVRRKWYRCLNLDGQESGHVLGCRFWGLGDATDEVEALLRLQRSDTPANTEEGHFVISGTVMESVFAPKAFQIRGAWGVAITGNLFGANSGPNSIDEGTIHITGKAGVDSANATNIVIAGNTFHNSAVVGSNGSGIYAETVDGLAILGNDFDCWQSNNVVRLRSDNVEQVSVLGNHFQKLGGPSATMYPVLLATGTSSVYSGDLVFSGNRIHGMTGPLVQRAGVTVTGSVRDDARYVSVNTVSAAGADNSINDSAANFPAWIGYVIAIAGFNDQTGNNRVASVVTATPSKIAKIVLSNMGGAT